MATNSEDRAAMIAACAKADVRLMVAYRCQYEQVNRAAIRAAQGGALGKLRFFQAANLQANGSGPQWRYSRALAGGGALPDIGLYCLNAARYLSNEEPVEVLGQAYRRSDDERFREVEESMSFTLRFPYGLLAQVQSSYGADQEKSLRLHGERGSMLVENAFAYECQ
jgi:predicted dehydrogenase